MQILLGTRKGLLILERNGSEWKVTKEDFRGIPVSYAWHDARTETLWSAAAHGHWGPKLCRQQGESEWEEVEGPHFQQGDMVRPDTPASVQYIWTLASGGESYPDRIFAGTIPGGLFVSNDGGDNFELVESLWNHPTRPNHWFGGGFDEPGIHSVIVDPRDNDRILLGISCAGVFESPDAGASWNIRNTGMDASFLPDPSVEVGFDPHLLIASPSHPHIFWQQNHDGIFRSTDDCATWERVDQKGTGPAYFGFAIAVDEANPDRAWVVPAESDQIRSAIDNRLFVCRTDDGGNSWQEFSAGLPQNGCYDLVYRHALDARGDIVVFGSTTGNLFVSDDAGESWDVASWNLPPVYSVQIL